MVSAEDLHAKNMSSTAKGTIEHPGTGVAQKRGLNRSLQRVGFRAMLDAVARSCQKNGTDFLRVPPYYTSQTCSLCGEIGKREKQAFTCTSCGVVIQADFNAARNLRKVAYLTTQAAAKQGRRQTRSHNPDRGCDTNKRLITRQPPGHPCGVANRGSCWRGLTAHRCEPRPAGSLRNRADHRRKPRSTHPLFRILKLCAR